MSSKFQIDINADVGEGLDNEVFLMPYLSSCNIACGGHAGDLATMTKVVRTAIIHNVKIGAHPSFPDKENFGRATLQMSSKDLFNSLKTQIETLTKLVELNGATLYHVKPHGALYNLVAKDIVVAQTVIDVITSLPNRLKLYAPHSSVISRLANEHKIDVVFEGFADRNYNTDLSLVSRQKANAIITNKEDVLEHVLRMVFDKKIRTINGVEVHAFVDTVCVHGDTKNAQYIVAYLHQQLKMKNIKIV